MLKGNGVFLISYPIDIILLTEYSTSDMSATSGLDYESVTGGQITFASGATTSEDGTVDIIPDLDTA